MKFIIGAPPYRHNSAGVRVLYRLGELLRDRDYEVTFLPPIAPIPYNPSETVVIYPETVSGNPLNINKVVRYLLNAPGLLGGDKEYPKTDLLVAYNPGHVTYSGGHLLQIPVIEDFFAPPPNGIKTIDCFWVGRGKNLNRHPTPCLEITPVFPDSRIGMARLLQSTKTLHTYDNFTCLIEEAHRCGCEVVFVDNKGARWHGYRIAYPSDVEVSDQLTTFINRCLVKWFTE